MALEKLAYTYEEAATELGCSSKLLRRAVKDNLLVATYLSPRKPVIRLGDLNAWLSSLPTERTP